MDIGKEASIEALGPKSAELLRRERDIFPTYYWSSESKLARFVVSKAKGSFLWDVDGNKYIDMSSQWATNNLGNVPDFLLEETCKALKQYGFLIYSLNPHLPLYEFAEVLLKYAPSKRLKRVIFDATGTGAVEASVKFAWASKKRPWIIGFYGQYHGVSIGGAILSSIDGSSKNYLEHLQGGIIHVPYPEPYRIPMNMTQEEFGDWIIDYIKDYILTRYAEPDRIAAILIEPIVLEGGVWIPPKKFMRDLRRLSDEYGWLLILDEVETGLGRTGKLFAIEHFNIEADLMPLAKGLSGGLLPIAAVMGSDEAMSVPIEVGTTFAGHPAACVAGKLNIEYMIKNKIPERAARLGEKALKIMEDWPERFKYVGDVRGIGLALGIEFVKNKESKEPFKEFGWKVFLECQKNGMIPLYDTDTWVIRLEPPLNIEEDILLEGIEILENAIKKAEKEV